MVVFALLHLNDPDGLVWFGVYGVVAGLGMVDSFRRIRSVLHLYKLCCIGLVEFSDFTMEWDK